MRRQIRGCVHNSDWFGCGKKEDKTAEDVKNEITYQQKAVVKILSQSLN